MLLQCLTILIMLVGLILTLLPRYPGTAVIFGGAVFYCIVAVPVIPVRVVELLAGLVLVAEIGGRLARVYLTRSYPLTRQFSVNSSVCNIGGLVAADLFIGPVLGAILWELLLGKVLQPRWDIAGQVLLWLTAIALLRLVCGLTMFALVALYLF